MTAPGAGTPAATSPGRAPTWAEGVSHLLAKLESLVASAAITINDARVIQHLAIRAGYVEPAPMPSLDASGSPDGGGRDAT